MAAGKPPQTSLFCAVPGELPLLGAICQRDILGSLERGGEVREAVSGGRGRHRGDVAADPKKSIHLAALEPQTQYNIDLSSPPYRGDSNVPGKPKRLLGTFLGVSGEFPGVLGSWGSEHWRHTTSDGVSISCFMGAPLHWGSPGPRILTKAWANQKSRDGVVLVSQRRPRFVDSPLEVLRLILNGVGFEAVGVRRLSQYPDTQWLASILPFCLSIKKRREMLEA